MICLIPWRCYHCRVLHEDQGCGHPIPSTNGIGFIEVHFSAQARQVRSKCERKSQHREKS